jgi:hypothetical protein
METLTSRSWIMADHLNGKNWGLLGALATALLTVALIAPAGAEAASPGSGGLGQLAAIVPAPAQSAVSAALSQVPSANGTGASGVPLPQAPPSVPVVTPPAPPPVPMAVRSTPLPAPASPAPVAPAPSPAGLVDAALSAPTRSVPRPDAVPTVNAAPSPSIAARPDATVEGHRPAHRRAHPRAHDPAARLMSARPPALTRRAPVTRVLFAQPWSPPPVLDGTSRRGAQPAAPARHADSRGGSGRGRHLPPRPSSPAVGVTTSQVALPLSAVLPPGGAEGGAAGAGGGAAGATAAVLALVGVCILRALLPGLLGLGLAPVQSALLVSRLERPG